MKHIAFFKLAPGADAIEVKEKIWKVYRRLDDELDWLSHPVVFRRCDDVESDFDLMVSIDIETESQLKEYLAHPLTKKLESQIDASVERTATFNHY